MHFWGIDCVTIFRTRKNYNFSGHNFSQIYSYFNLNIYHTHLSYIVDLGCWLPRGDHLRVYSVPPDRGVFPRPAYLDHDIPRGRGGRHGEKPARIYSKISLYVIDMKK